MFDVHCTHCERRQLIFPGQITGMVNDDAGILVHYRCWCGAPSAWRTGVAAGERAGAESRGLVLAS